jgi:maltose alpha-D-glucosyltransferase / alpha-amylase
MSSRAGEHPRIIEGCSSLRCWPASCDAHGAGGIVAIEDLWYKNAVIYCLPVAKYMDSDGDGVGDFEGLSRRLDYLSGLGVTCVWLQPYFPSPFRDNGYDIGDFYGVDPRHGSPGEFVEFMNHARAVGMRVIVDLVVNHTSIEHRWFQQARSDPRSSKRDWYVWSDDRPPDHEQGIVFPGVQKTTWSWDPVAKQYYFHRFYDFQPDLATDNKWVRDEITRIMGYWLELGVSGFRMDAVPFLIEHKGAHVEHAQDFELLHEMRHFLQWRCRDAIMLAEANVPPDESMKYFGNGGDRLQMMLNFPVNQRLWYALATGDLEPLIWALHETRRRPPEAQWAQFLRSHDELDLGRLSPEERRQVFDAFGPDASMQLYNRGIRRRLAPMLGDRRRVELALHLMFSLPGTPVMLYGDEIGIGDNLELPERECARTPMQWTRERHGGFTLSDAPISPINCDTTYGYQVRNVADERRDPHSLLNWTERVIRARKECPEISWGDFVILPTDANGVLGMRYDWRNTSLVTMHNFRDARAEVAFKVDAPRGELLVNVFEENHSTADRSGVHHVSLDAYGYRWYRVGSADNAIYRSAL